MLLQLYNYVVSNTCGYRMFNMSNFCGYSNWSNFGTKNCLNVSIHITTVKKLFCFVYLYLRYDFLNEYTEKFHFFSDVNNLWLISYTKNMVFLYFSKMLIVVTTFFCKTSQYPLLWCEFWKINTYLGSEKYQWIDMSG